MTLIQNIYYIMLMIWDDDDVFVRKYLSKLQGHVFFLSTYSSEVQLQPLSSSAPEHLNSLCIDQSISKYRSVLILFNLGGQSNSPLEVI